jgi:ribonucleoside-diphosphate reductase alpha chain
LSRKTITTTYCVTGFAKEITMQPTMPPVSTSTDSHQGSAPYGEQDSELQMTAPGQMRVIKRNGKLVSYTDDKIKVAITKAFLAVEGGQAAASSRYSPDREPTG